MKPLVHPFASSCGPVGLEWISRFLQRSPGCQARAIVTRLGSTGDPGVTETGLGTSNKLGIVFPPCLFPFPFPIVVAAFLIDDESLGIAGQPQLQPLLPMMV